MAPGSEESESTDEGITRPGHIERAEETTEYLARIAREREKELRGEGPPKPLRPPERPPTGEAGRGEKTEAITAKAEGGETTYYWPESDEGKIARMRDYLALVESTNQPNGGAAYKNLMEELGLVITTLISERFSADPEKEKRWRNIGSTLLREYQARMALHNQFLEFMVAGDGEKVSNALKPLRGEYLNLIIKDLPEVWKGFLLYEANAKRLLRAQGIQIEQIRQEIRTGIEISRRSHPPLDAQSAQRMAERLWMTLSRRAVHNEVVDKNSRQVVTDEKKKREAGYEVSFLAEEQGGSGPQTLLKIMQTQNWLCTRKKDFDIGNPQIDLLDGVDLDQQEFFSFFAGQIEEFYEKLLYERYRETVPESGWVEARRRAKTDAQTVAEILTGNHKEPKMKSDEPGVRDVDKVTGLPATKWSKVVDVTKFKWNLEDLSQAEQDELVSLVGRENVLKGIDFAAILGEYSLDKWSTLKIKFPYQRLNAMTDNEASFIRNPTKESLFALNKDFATEWEQKEKLLENFGELAGSEEYVKIGKSRYNREGKIALVNKAAGLVDESGIPFIRYAKKNKIIRKILNENNLERFVRGTPFKFAYSFLFGTLWGMLLKALGYVFKS